MGRPSRATLAVLIALCVGTEASGALAPSARVELAPGEGWVEVQLELTNPGDAAITDVAVVLVAHRDGAGRPESLVLAENVPVGSPPSGESSLEIDFPSYAGPSAWLPLRIVNPGAETIAGTGRMVAAGPALGTPPSRSFRLRGGERTELAFRLPPEALRDGRAAFAIVEFVESGAHVSVVRRAELDPVGAEPPAPRIHLQTILLAALLGLLFVVVAVVESRGRGERRVRLESVTSEVWQEHYGRCRRSSLYQDPRWLTLIEVVYPRLPVHRLACLASDGKPMWLLPVVELKPLFERSPMLISLPFGNYGGFLLPLEDPSPVTSERLEPLRCFFESSRAFALEIRQLDAPPDGLETHDAFCRFELELPDDPDLLWHKQLTGNTRNMVRKAEKLGVEAVFDADDAVCEFQRIYERASSHFGTPIHHVRWYETLRETFPGETRILLGRLEGRFVAGLFVLEDGDRILVHAALTDPAHRKIPVQDLLYWSLMRRVIEERGRATLDFGRTRRDEAKRFFKRRWGGVEKPIFYSYLLKPGRRPPEILPENPKLAPAVRLWRLIPRPLQRWIGPHLRVRIPT